MSLAGRTVLVVGGTSGMGLAAAQAAAAAGARVAVTGRGGPSMAAALATLPTGAQGLTLDFADPAALGAFAAAAAADPPDHLVLAGAGPGAWGPFAQMDEAALRAAFDAKFWPHWRLARALGPALPPDGSLLFVAGAAARAAIPGTSGLAAVNGALTALAGVLAVELAPRRVNVLSPGTTDTDAYAGMPAEARAAMFADIAARLPAGRIGTAADMGAAILFALSSPFLTGAVLDVDGGASLARG